MTNKDELVQLARLAEQAERYSIGSHSKYTVSACRSSWRIISGIEQETLLDKYLIPKATTAESKIVYLEMKGDYYRYLTEITVGSEQQTILNDADTACRTANQAFDNALTGLDSIDDDSYRVWYVELFPHSSISSCQIPYNLTTCDFVYSVVVPRTNNISFVYNCIDIQGNNVIGVFTSNGTCESFQLNDEQIVSNYSTQDNFLIAIDGQGTGVYSIADDFVCFYQLYPTFELFVWPNTIGISPRGMHIGSNQDYAVVAGYCQSTPSSAVECGFYIRLNTSLSSPYSISKFNIAGVLYYPWSDPRVIRYMANSQTYTAQSVMSVSICWNTQQVLIGIQSLNTVLLYSLNDTHNPISTRQNGVGYMGFGKSVAWLDDTGEKAVILANTYIYSTYEWISSAVHIYNIESDGFSDSTQPILVYPNSQQVLLQMMAESLIRLSCSPAGNLGILDSLSNGVGILVAPPGYYPNTNIDVYATNSIPCNRGTNRTYAGIELCSPYSSSSMNCSEDSFCPYGAVGEVLYSAFETIEQIQEYPESPENTVFDDILMQNMFAFNVNSVHCLLVSPLVWVVLVMLIGLSVALFLTISEALYPEHHSMQDNVKKVFRKIDLIGEGEMWIGGLISAAIIVLVVSAYSFSNSFLRQYPIEDITHNSSFACDVTLRNAKFSTTTQQRWDPRRSTKESQTMFDLLNAQLFTLNIDLVQTAFTCDDQLYVQRFDGYETTIIPITKCQTKYNDTTLSLTILLPAQVISVRLVLPGLNTVGAIRIGLSGPAAEAEDGRFTLMALNFASTFVSSSLDQVLAESMTFPIELTEIVNQTDPLNSNDVSKFSGIWSSSLTVNSAQLFTNESQYTFLYRTTTNISITIEQNIFYIGNLQQPIARQTEVIFRSLLFTIVVLEVFGLIFLLIKLLFMPVFRTIHERLRQRSPKIHDSEIDDISKIKAENDIITKVIHENDQNFIKRKCHRRWSTTAIARKPCHD
ncbi:unnamed protein product [Adineta steineri]|uniref:14-3-3 domain-containing protein n=1 Tax=Adineta steineri TaxID=433720 RepID=A0A814PTD7_9BILA|nr:unnamed protein product [Adineta steineri]CAF1110539.1 unnamed protein product [Adineta steineri]